MKSFKQFYSEYMAENIEELEEERYKRWVDTALKRMGESLLTMEHNGDCTKHSHACEACHLQHLLMLYTKDCFD